MKYTAIYTLSKGGLYHDMTTHDYNSKSDFSSDLRKNGYHVVAILTDNIISQIRNDVIETTLKYSERLCAYVTQVLD